MGLLDRGVEIKTPEQIDLMRKAGLVVGQTLELLRGSVRAGISTAELDAILAERGHRLDAVLELTVDEEAVVGRLLKRAAEQAREDDTEEVIRERQAIYRKETAPLTELYGARGLLRQVDGMGTVDEVFERISGALSGAVPS